MTLRTLFGNIIVDKFIARESVVPVWLVRANWIKQRKWELRYQNPF
jgi:hypothetical protein